MRYSRKISNFVISTILILPLTVLANPGLTEVSASYVSIDARTTWNRSLYSLNNDKLADKYCPAVCGEHQWTGEFRVHSTNPNRSECRCIIDSK